MHAEPAEWRDSYDEFVARSRQGSVFARSWWLDVVAPGSWQPHLVTDDAGAITAAWPTIVRSSRWGDLHVGAPLTPFLGPMLAPEDNAHRRRSAWISQLELLLATFDGSAHIEARCNPAFDYWTPLAWNGFTQTTSYTWRINDLSDTEAVFAGLRDNIRREVRKAAKQGVTIEVGTVDDLLPLVDQTFARQGMESLVSHDLVRTLDVAAREHDAGEVLVARDGEGRIHSAGFYVRDEHMTWYLIGGSNPELRTSGSASAMMWSAIERAAARGTAFDFEGSMLRHVERFVRAFGGDPVAYSTVHRTSSRGFRRERAVKLAVRRMLGRARS